MNTGTNSSGRVNPVANQSSRWRSNGSPLRQRVTSPASPSTVVTPTRSIPTTVIGPVTFSTLTGRPSGSGCPVSRLSTSSGVRAAARATRLVPRTAMSTVTRRRRCEPSKCPSGNTNGSAATSKTQPTVRPASPVASSGAAAGTEPGWSITPPLAQRRRGRPRPP